MMNVILIEDEAIAMRRLRKLLSEADSSIVVIAALESVAEARLWFSSHPVNSVQVVFADIHLSDGVSFDIFESLNLRIPVVFTTAYSEYAIRAFKVNGIDYLLKPLQIKEVKAALEKIKKMGELFSPQPLNEIRLLMQQLQIGSLKPDPTFLAFKKDKIIPLKSDDIAWFRVKDQDLTVHMINNETYTLDDTTMDTVEKRLPKSEFFKVNRQYIVARKAIVEAEFYFNSRLSIKLAPSANETVVISRERVSLFRNWLQGLAD